MRFITKPSIGYIHPEWYHLVMLKEREEYLQKQKEYDDRLESKREEWKPK